MWIWKIFDDISNADEASSEKADKSQHEEHTIHKDTLSEIKQNKLQS